MNHRFLLSLCLASIAACSSEAPPLRADSPPQAVPSATAAATTVQETPAAPKSAARRSLQDLESISVRKRFPQLAAQDAERLPKVGEALGLATADMFVHYVSHGAKSEDRMAPIVVDGAQLPLGAADERWDPTDAKAAGLAKFGGKIVGFLDGEAWGVGVVELKGYPPSLADGTPGLVWQVDSTTQTARFLPLDGARPYEISLRDLDKGPALEAGAGPSARWPAPVSDPLLGRLAVTFLSPDLPGTLAKDLSTREHELGACASKMWEGVKKKIDSKKALPAGHPWTGLNPMEIARLEARTACKKNLDAAETTFVALIEQRIKDRKALFEKARARVTAVGADK